MRSAAKEFPTRSKLKQPRRGDTPALLAPGKRRRRAHRRIEQIAVYRRERSFGRLVGMHDFDRRAVRAQRVERLVERPVPSAGARARSVRMSTRSKPTATSALSIE
jgi:hypothetical protein